MGYFDMSTKYRDPIRDFKRRKVLTTQELIMIDKGTYFIQGDLLFIRAFDEPPSRDPDSRFVETYSRTPENLMAATSEFEETENGYFVLARGEKTGHSHRIAADVAEVRRSDQRPRDDEVPDLIMGLWENAEVVHEEHPPLKLEPGTYVVRQQREFNPYREIEERDQERTISRARFD